MDLENLNLDEGTGDVVMPIAQDDYSSNEEEPVNPNPQTPIVDFSKPPVTNDNNDDRSVITSLLKYFGNNDPNKLLFEEDGIVKEKSWDDLSFEEKMNILKTSYTTPERDLDEAEVNLINEIRRRNLTPTQYIDQIKEQSVAQYEDQAATSHMKIDDLSDDEIFILNLQDQVEDITDEEIQQALELAKQNESLFKRQVNGIRTELKQQEDAYNQQLQLEKELANAERFNLFSSAVKASVGNFNSIGNLDLNLDDNDRDDLMSFILDVDDTGMSTLGKTLNDPNMLVKLSWFALHGDKALKDIEAYYTDQITKANQSGYNKGLQDGKKGTSRVLYTKLPIGNNKTNRSIDDIYG